MYSSSLVDKGKLRDDNTDYNFLSKSKRLCFYFVFWVFFPDLFPMEELEHVQSEWLNVSLANRKIPQGSKLRIKQVKKGAAQSSV